MAAGTASLRVLVPALLAVPACGGGDLVLPTGGPPGSMPDADASSIAADPGSIPAGGGSASISVTVRDAEGAPVAGAGVTLDATGQGNTLIQPSGPTGANGVAAGTLQSATPGAKVVSATVNQAVRLRETVTVMVTASGGVERLAYRVPPPGRVKAGENFRVEVALVDAAGDVVPLNGIVVYLGLFEDGRATPTNKHLRGERFEDTEAGVAALDLAVGKPGRYRLRALTDELPELGPHGPEPYLFSEVFEVD